MAGRGGGWGFRGRGRGAYVRPVPFVVFPEDINLPDAKPGEVDASMRRLCKLDHEFDNFFRSAPYFLEEKAQFKGRKRKMHVQRFSDKKKTSFTRDSLPQVLVYDEFIKELVPGKTMLSRKKRTWNPEEGQKKLAAMFDDIEKSRLEDSKRKKEEKDEESEDEVENEEGNESEDDFQDGDYNQNEYFDDDEDDYNVDDTGPEEAEF